MDNKLNIPYDDKWTITNIERFSKEDAKVYSGAEVVPWDYGMSVCLTMADGNHKQYVPLSKDSKLRLGDKPELTNLQVLTLQCDGGCCIKIKEV